MNHFEVISSKSSYYYVTICRVCMSLFLPKRMHYMPTLYAFDPLTPFIFCPLIQLYVSQPLGAGAAGENPCQPPRSGEGLLQQRAMSVCNPPNHRPTSSEHCHNTAAGSLLTSLPALLIQCAKVKFFSPHLHRSRWISEDSPSLSASL